MCARRHARKYVSMAQVSESAGASCCAVHAMAQSGMSRSTAAYRGVMSCVGVSRHTNSAGQRRSRLRNSTLWDDEAARCVHNVLVVMLPAFSCAMLCSRGFLGLIEPVSVASVGGDTCVNFGGRFNTSCPTDCGSATCCFQTGVVLRLPRLHSKRAVAILTHARVCLGVFTVSYLLHSQRCETRTWTTSW